MIENQKIPGNGCFTMPGFEQKHKTCITIQKLLGYFHTRLADLSIVVRFDGGRPWRKQQFYGFTQYGAGIIIALMSANWTAIYVWIVW
jgi:hypothetical protein